MKKEKFKEIERKESLIKMLEDVLDDSVLYNSLPSEYISFASYKLIYGIGVTDEYKIAEKAVAMAEAMKHDYFKLTEKEEIAIINKERRKNSIYEMVEKTGMVPSAYAKHMARSLAYNNNNNFGNNYEAANEAACDYITRQYTEDFLDMLREEKENNKGRER